MAADLKSFIADRVRLVNGGCWQWTAYIHPTGYGFTCIRGRGSVGAHCLSYEVFNGDRRGLSVLHRCDNRKCVNPAHLFLGTRAENNSDRDSKGRQATGARIFTTKLNADQVREIRAQFANGDPKKTIARRFGVTGKNVEAIVNRQTWKYI